MRWSTGIFAMTIATLAVAGGGDDTVEKVYYDGLDDHGRLTGGFTWLERPDLQNVAVSHGAYTTILDNGPSSNRIDFVYVGDGYLESELGNYADHVLGELLDLLAQEPFATYVNYFNAHLVDVISNESGVDNDPVQGILRDTALDMGFWCSGIERLLCVNVSEAYSYATNAPGVNQVVAVANSTKYGGAGYSSSNLATFSGGNGSSAEIAIHELGHSLGNLADEYDYDDGATYTGAEPTAANVSIYDSDQMAGNGTKWADWLGDPGVGFDGLVSTFEGAMYHEFGIYRPSINSKMRSLNRPFNLPSVDALIIEIYRTVQPLDDHTPATRALDGTETVFIEPLQPVGHDLDVEWRLDGEVIAPTTPDTVDLAMLGLDIGGYLLSVTVTDNTALVRDELARAAWMSQTVTWDIVIPQPGDVDGDFDVDRVDLLLLLAVWGTAIEGPPDFDGDGIVGTTDLLFLLANWAP